MTKHYMVVVKRDDIEMIADFFKRNSVIETIDTERLDSMISGFGDKSGIDNFVLYLDRSKDSNYEYIGWDYNENITLDNDEESLKLIMNKYDFYDPSVGLVTVDLSNIEEIQSNIEDYYFDSRLFSDCFSADFNSDVNDDYKNPAHYKHGKYDLITHLADIFTEEELRGFLKGNIYKYVDRYRDKNGIEDLEKAKEYTHRLEEFEKKVNGKDNEFVQ